MITSKTKCNVQSVSVSQTANTDTASNHAKAPSSSSADVNVSFQNELKQLLATELSRVDSVSKNKTPESSNVNLTVKKTVPMPKFHNDDEYDDFNDDDEDDDYGEMGRIFESADMVISSGYGSDDDEVNIKVVANNSSSVRSSGSSKIQNQKLKRINDISSVKSTQSLNYVKPARTVTSRAEMIKDFSSIPLSSVASLVKKVGGVDDDWGDGDDGVDVPPLDHETYDISSKVSDSDEDADIVRDKKSCAHKKIERARGATAPSAAAGPNSSVLKSDLVESTTCTSSVARVPVKVKSYDHSLDNPRSGVRRPDAKSVEKLEPPREVPRDFRALEKTLKSSSRSISASRKTESAIATASNINQASTVFSTEQYQSQNLTQTQTQTQTQNSSRNIVIVKPGQRIKVRYE